MASPGGREPSHVTSRHSGPPHRRLGSLRGQTAHARGLKIGITIKRDECYPCSQFFLKIANDGPFLDREIHHLHMWPLIVGPTWAHPTLGRHKGQRRE